MSDSFATPWNRVPPGFSVHRISQARTPGVGCHFLLQGIFPTQGLNLHLLRCRRILYCWTTREATEMILQTKRRCSCKAHHNIRALEMTWKTMYDTVWYWNPVFIVTKQSGSFCCWASGQVTPKYATMAHWLFELKLLKWKSSRSVVSNSLQPPGLEPTGLLRPWDSPGKNTGVDYHFLLQGIFLTQGSNRGLPHWRQTL